MNYTKHYSTKITSQNQPIPGKNMVKNNAEGFVFAIDDWSRLDRFLILGTEGGTYYVNESKFTIENAEAVTRCISANGIKVVNKIVEVSDLGQAPKNDPALFALAMCAGIGNAETKKAALQALPKVARIGTHLFHFLEFVQHFRGWGRGLRNAIAAWYDNRAIEKLEYQVIKYQQRDGWSHRDALRLSHPRPDNDTRNNLYRWIVGKESDITNLHLISAFQEAQKTDSKKEMIKLIGNHKLTREMIPTQWLNDCDIWAALLENMPLTAMIRNLGKMTNIELLQPMGRKNKTIIEKLNQENIHKSRIHPLSILVALKVYSQGHGMRGSLSWSPVAEIIDALDNAFYLSFQNVEASGKRVALALDISGSMTWSNIAGMPITPREASAALALVTTKTEPQYWCMAFCDTIVDLSLSKCQRIDDVLRLVGNLHFGGTDCALPMLEALKRKIDVDTFCIYTDSETWYGGIHPVQALDMYRQKTGIPAKLIVLAMTSTGFSIADPNDNGMLDVVGFDTTTPQIITNFARN